MKQTKRIKLLGIYNLILALGATLTGIMMISSRGGIFTQYPEEWLNKVPFESWLIPGIIIIVIFGLGNIIAAIFSFKKETNKPWIWSAIMGSILFISLVFQVIILDELYLATVEFLILSIIQLYLSGYMFICYRMNLYN